MSNLPLKLRNEVFRGEEELSRNAASNSSLSKKYTSMLSKPKRQNGLSGRLAPSEPPGGRISAASETASESTVTGRLSANVGSGPSVTSNGGPGLPLGSNQNLLEANQQQLPKAIPSVKIEAGGSYWQSDQSQSSAPSDVTVPGSDWAGGPPPLQWSGWGES